MFLRSILELSSRRAVTRIPRQISTPQIPAYLRKELSTKPQEGTIPQPNESGKPPESGGSVSKIVVGSAVVGAAILAAYQTGYLDQVLGGKNWNDSLRAVKGDDEEGDVKGVKKFEDHVVLPDSKEANEVASSSVDEKVEKVESLLDSPHVEPLSEREDRDHSQVQDKSDVKPEEADILAKEKDLVDYSRSSTISDDQSSNSEISSEASQELDTMMNAAAIADKVSDEEAQTSSVFTQSNEADKKSEVKEVPPAHLTVEEREEHAIGKDVEEPSSLLEEYNLGDEADGRSNTFLYKHSGNNYNHLAKEEEALSSALEELGDGYISKDGKLVLDFLQAIHAAESRQAELDARMYAEEKRALKEKYEKELKDAAVRELMLAEEAAMLDKELKRERAKAAGALKSLQEQLEEKYKIELEQKKRVAEYKLKKAEELAKVELAGKIASEKAAQIEKMAEANLHINALCMAFYARSEEARRNHSAHKLALGALALEDTLSKGLPIQTEIGALHNYLEGIDKDSVLDLVLSSLPEETRNGGTDTLLQLNQKFNTLKRTLRHFSLIPPGGGGILTHSVAHVASWLKVKETDQSGDGIESLINKVESHLAEGKIAEAADALEEGVQGTQASEIVSDWVRRARNRAITEQALTLLQSYATSVSVT